MPVATSGFVACGDGYTDAATIGPLQTLENIVLQVSANPILCQVAKRNRHTKAIFWDTIELPVGIGSWGFSKQIYGLRCRNATAGSVANVSIIGGFPDDPIPFSPASGGNNSDPVIPQSSGTPPTVNSLGWKGETVWLNGPLPSKAFGGPAANQGYLNCSLLMELITAGTILTGIACYISSLGQYTTYEPSVITLGLGTVDATGKITFQCATANVRDSFKTTQGLNLFPFTRPFTQPITQPLWACIVCNNQWYPTAPNLASSGTGYVGLYSAAAPGYPASIYGYEGAGVPVIAAGNTWNTWQNGNGVCYWMGVY